MILNHDDIVAAVRSGLISLTDVTDIRATSIDMRVDKLFALKPNHSFRTEELVDLPYREFKKQALIEIPLSEGGFWIVREGEHYLGETIESISLREFFSAEMISRSSWARYGVYVQEIDNDLKTVGKRFQGNVPFMIASYGPTVLVRHADKIGQLVISFGYRTPLSDTSLEEALQKKEVILKRGGRTLSSSEVIVRHGIQLTNDCHIKMFRGGTIDPHLSVDDFFETVEVLPSGLEVQRGQFFISSSKEEVEINQKYIGWVNQSNYHFQGDEAGNCGPVGIVTQKTHPNAPKIDPSPVFRGKITFENRVYVDHRIYPGERLTELQLCQLYSPYFPRRAHISRYCGQERATVSKGHL